MKAIRVATIANGNPDDMVKHPRIRLELRKHFGGYLWFAQNTDGAMELIEGQDLHKTVAQAVRVLYAWYNVPEWELVTAHVDNRGWTYANPRKSRGGSDTAPNEERDMLADQIKAVKAAKALNPTAILLYRIGDFYEAFNEDAAVVADVCHITLTKRTINGQPLRMAGVPYHAVDSYQRTLVDAGYIVNRMD